MDVSIARKLLMKSAFPQEGIQDAVEDLAKRWGHAKGRVHGAELEGELAGAGEYAIRRGGEIIERHGKTIATGILGVVGLKMLLKGIARAGERKAIHP